MARENCCCVFDFTLKAEGYRRNDIIVWLDEHCKKWAFQLECGEETGYKHYQGRVSLKVKTRLSTLINITKGTWTFRWSITHDYKNEFYVMKEHTRIDGPWDDRNDKPIYVPRQIREIKELYPWQQSIIDISLVWDTRSIHCIIDPEGNKGKSILCTYMAVNRLGRKIPYANNYKDIMRIVCDMPTTKAYIVDLPRGVDKRNLNGMFAAIEEIKSGYAWDDRYKFQEKFFDAPQIFVFTNIEPDRNSLSLDRWRFYNIIDKKLVSMADYL